MSNNELALEMREINRRQYKVMKALKDKHEPVVKRRKRRLNKGMCFFWLNAFAVLAFIVSNVVIKLHWLSM